MADDIGPARAMLQALVLEERIPPKLPMVHQFIDAMVGGGGAIHPSPNFDAVLIAQRLVDGAWPVPRGCDLLALLEWWRP